MKHLRNILNCKYQPADIQAVVNSCDNLDNNQKLQLYNLLKNHKPLLDRLLGRMKSKPYDIKLKPRAVPYHAKPFPIPHIHEARPKAKVQQLVDIGVLTKVNDSKWQAPTWVIPKRR